MTPIEIILLVGLVIVIGLQWRNRMGPPSNDSAQLKAELDMVIKKSGELIEKLRQAESKRDELAGKNKEIFVTNTKLEADLKSANKSVAKYEAEEQKTKDQSARELQELMASRKALEDERIRVQRADEDRLHRIEEERDRVWAEHENSVIAQLTSLCKLPQLAFEHFTNTTTPEDFVSLKPDFMIEFLDQYIIFDAKASKAESLQTYINSAMKTTIQKVKKSSRIASIIFLVVPSQAINELKKFVYPIDGYTIYIVSPESLAPILAFLKKITTYEFADQMDPQQRENIVQLIADLDFHINLRNAADIILTKMGAQVLEKAKLIDSEISNEVALKKQPMNAKVSIASSDLKKLVGDLTAQNIEIQQLVSPKSAISRKELKAAEKMITETML